MNKSAFLSLMLILSFGVFAQETSVDGLYTKNQDGGKIVLSSEECSIEIAKKNSFNYRAYATDKNNATHEGCWSAPSMKDAPKSNGSVKVVPVVNIYFDGEVHTFLLEWFKPMPSRNSPEDGETWI